MNQQINKKKMITSNGFRYSSPPKKAFPGDYNGTFTKPYIFIRFLNANPKPDNNVWFFIGTAI